jgi:ribonuclease HI
MTEASKPHVQLFTDGACLGNPGPGGWAYVLKHPASGSKREDSGAEPQTTNNRMELRAVIEGLAAITRPSLIDLTSDSQYVLNGLKEWMKSWKKRGWKTSTKEPVKNVDLFHWIRGHTGHAENERCDELSVIAAEAVKRGDQSVARPMPKIEGIAPTTLL